MKWLDPKTHPIPANTPVIGYIKQQEDSEYSPFCTAVQICLGSLKKRGIDDIFN